MSPPRTGVAAAAAVTIAFGVVAALALVNAGCGSEEANPPPAEPANSPPLGRQPAGEVIAGSSEAEGVVIDPVSGLAAVAFRDPGRLELIDVTGGKSAGTVKTPDPARHLALAGPGGPVLVPVEFKDMLLRVELPSGDSSSVRVGDFPHDAAQAPDGRIFVGDEGGDTISVIEGNDVTDTLPAPEQPGGVAVSGNVLAVVAVAAREVAFYDTDTLEQLGVVDAGAGPSHVVAGSDGRFYVTDTGGDAILVFEGRGPDGRPRLLDRTNVSASPYGIAIDKRRKQIWVTRTGTNRVVRMEITDLAPKIGVSFPTVRQPNSVAVDERTGQVVVVGRDDGDVQIFDPEDPRGGSKP